MKLKILDAIMYDAPHLVNNLGGTAWVGHIPFSFWLVAYLKPKTIHICPPNPIVHMINNNPIVVGFKTVKLGAAGNTIIKKDNKIIPKDKFLGGSKLKKIKKKIFFWFKKT